MSANCSMRIRPYDATEGGLVRRSFASAAPKSLDVLRPGRNLEEEPVQRSHLCSCAQGSKTVIEEIDPVLVPVVTSSTH